MSATSSVRELRPLVPFEVLAVLAIAVAPIGDTFPFALLLLAVATTSRWIRGRSWAELVVAGRASTDVTSASTDVASASANPAASQGLVRALAVGGVAGLLAIAVAAPLIGAFRVTTIDWWVLPAIHGDAAQLALVSCVLLATAIALELALRGWIIERMLELSPGPTTLPIATAALAEALVTPGPIVSRIGVALFGAGLGLLYVALRRNVLAPIAARCVFVMGAVLVERFSG